MLGTTRLKFCATTGAKSAACFIASAARSNRQMKLSISGIWSRSPESSLSKTGNKCAKSPRSCRSTISWSKRIVLIWRRFRFGENAANRPIRGWSRKRLRVRAEFLWKKSLARRPQLHKNSSDLIVGNIGNYKVDIVARHFLIAALAILLASCAAPSDTEHHIVVSVHDQKLALLEKGNLVASYPISTSKFGLNDRPGSFGTPLSEWEIADKIGDGAPAGTVFKDRRRTGEVVAVNAPGRDPIVTRIIWLRGKEGRNANAFRRDIYIHGTPEERNIGRPASYGCIRMRSIDIINLYSQVGSGAQVSIITSPLTAVLPELTAGTQIAEQHHALGVIR